MRALSPSLSLPLSIGYGHALSLLLPPPYDCPRHRSPSPRGGTNDRHLSPRHDVGCLMNTKEKAISVVRDVLSLRPHEHEPVALWVRALGTGQVYVVTAIRDGRVYTYEVEVTPGRNHSLSLLCTAPLFNG